MIIHDLFLADSLEILFRHLAALAARVQVAVVLGTAYCLGFGGVSRMVHSRYRRSLLGVAVGSREGVIDLLGGRFFCDQTDCGRKTLAQPADGLTVPHARHASAAFALAMGGPDSPTAQ